MRARTYISKNGCMTPKANNTGFVEAVQLSLDSEEEPRTYNIVINDLKHVEEKEDTDLSPHDEGRR